MVAPGGHDEARKLNIAVLISGRGSNLQSLITNAAAYNIVGVFSNKAEAPGLALAAAAGIPTTALSRSDFVSVAEQKRAIQAAVVACNPDFVFLAGYMQIVAPEFIAAFPNRIINIHPALLPAYPGLDTHARALADCQRQGVPLRHGCTVHLVDAGVDTGKIIAQAAVPCEPSDTEEGLAARVLAREHVLYPWVANCLGRGEIICNEAGLQSTAVARQRAAAQGFSLAV